MSAKPNNPEWLLTPGPLTTSAEVRAAMQKDWGSWDADFRALTRTLRSELLAIAGDTTGRYDCVPMQGSGTFVVEAMLGAFVPKEGKALVLSNGAYGLRIARTLDYLGRDYQLLDKGDYLPPRAAEVQQLLTADAAITHVVLVHCETSSGILNPLQEIADCVAANQRKLLVDSMSAFGALPLECGKVPFQAMVSSANKCIEGVPGFGFVIAEKTAIEASQGNSHSLALDIHDQWSTMEKTGQWRFTPPTHCVAAFVEALRRHKAQGGAAARLARYTENASVLVEEMRNAGFETLLHEPWLSPIIVTFLNPDDPAFDFPQFYELLKAQGYIIYPGKLTVTETFRMGCIGDFNADVMRGAALAAVEALNEMGVQQAAPSSAAREVQQVLSG